MALGSKSSNNSTTKEPQKRAKKGFSNALQALINRCFAFLKEVAKLLWLLLENAARLTVFCFSLLVKLMASPTTPPLVAIICFGAVCSVAATQWYQIGVWIGRMLGISGIWGIGAGTAGVLLGVGLNIYQLAPQLWKLRRDIGEAYQALGINPEYQAESENSVPERVQNWLSMDHSTLKGIRLATYAIETGLVVVYCFMATGLQFFAIVQAAISLVLPEKCLGLVSATISTLGAVSDKVNAPEPDHVTF